MIIHRRLSFVNLETNIIFKRIIIIVVVIVVFVVDYQNGFECQKTNITKKNYFKRCTKN